MGSKTDALHELAAAIAEGSAVDWDDVEGEVSEPEQQSLVEQLRLIARIAGVHRSQDDPPEPTRRSRRTALGDDPRGATRARRHAISGGGASSS